MKWIKIRAWMLAAASGALLTGCAAWMGPGVQKQVGSAVDYLFPDARQAPSMVSAVTELRLPLRVGLAFAPGASQDIPENEKRQHLERIKQAFAGRDFIEAIELIPTSYLQPKGGFANLDQVARMFNVEVVALVSYDQIQFSDANALSMLYWTVVGAYVIQGDRYDIQTMVDASVFDVKSRRLLFRAPGQSRVKGNATLVGFGEAARQARSAGYSRAVDDLIPQLQASLNGFQERVKTDSAVRIERKDGYRGGGAASWVQALAALGVLALLWARLRRQA